MAYSVIVLKDGYSLEEGAGYSKAGGTITLVKGPQKILVDTGSPWDKQRLLDGLKANDLTPEQINYVVCTHGHSDHVGNLNLFPNSVHIVSHDICVGDQYFTHDFKAGIPYEIDDMVEVVATPGHTAGDVSVIVKQTEKGTVAITGDLFECLGDLEDPDLWQSKSDAPELQQQSRIRILREADHIVPGHGPMFAVPAEYKRRLRVIMYYEKTTVTEGSTTAISSQYEVVEME